MRAYWAGFVRGFRRVVADPTDLLTRVGFFFVILVVLAALWRAAIEAGGRGSIAGYDLRALMWYVLAAQAAVAGVRTRTIEEIGDDIGGGGVAVAMLRPVSVVGMRLAIDGGEAAARLIAVFVCGGLLTWWLIGPPPSLPSLALALPAAVLGCAANMAAQHAFGAIAFWLKDAKSAWFLYQKLVFLPGGMLIPLELMPGPVAAVSRPLPFAAMAYIPGRFGAGFADPALLLWQCLWVVLLVAAAVGMFALGQRRLEVVGG